MRHLLGMEQLSRPQIEQMVAKQAIEIEKYKDVLG